MKDYNVYINLPNRGYQSGTAKDRIKALYNAAFMTPASACFAEYYGDGVDDDDVTVNSLPILCNVFDAVTAVGGNVFPCHNGADEVVAQRFDGLEHNTMEDFGMHLPGGYEICGILCFR